MLYTDFLLIFSSFYDNGFLDYNDFWSSTVVEEAESLGLVAASVTGIFMISCKLYFVSKGWIGSKDGLNILAQGIYTFIRLVVVVVVAD